MPKNIKKFKLTYQQVPEVFALPKKMYLQDEAETIPEETLEQTEAQKTLIAETVTTLNKDSDRTCYVDFAGRKVSQLKADWLVCNAAGKLELAKEVYPDYTQGNNTGASVGENLYSFQFYIPMSISNPTSCGQIKRQAICFAYRNAAGEPAGFSLMASGNASEYQDWIISTIQNTTAHPKKRVVTVLSTPGIVTSKAKASVLMDNPTTIQMELKEAIKNDTVSRLIEGIFNPDGSLNSDYINSLDSRITPDLNIDDRDRKESRLSTLFELSNTVNQSELNDYIASVKEQISIDINFFENIVFENHLNTTLNRLAVALSQRPGTTKTVEEITTTLEKISECSAHFEQLAECSHRNPEQVNTYKALAEKIRSNAALLRFNGTKVDDKKIAQITQLDVSQVIKIKILLIRRCKRNFVNSLIHQKKVFLAEINLV